MAKLQVLIAMTLDGSIPAEDDPLLQWMRDDKDGFSYGRDKCTRRLYPGYPLHVRERHVRPIHPLSSRDT